MLRRATHLICLAALAFGGCNSVHTDSGQNLTVAFWPQFVIYDQQEHPIKPPAASLVTAALGKAGIHAVVDANGVSVPAVDADHAREVLITDPSLKGSDITVLIVVAAGSAQYTNGGVIIPLVAAPTTRRFP